MPDIEDWRARYAEIDAALASGMRTPDDRARLKADIVALFRTVEQRLAELTQLKDQVKGLVEKWKVVSSTAAPSTVPSTVPSMAPSVAPRFADDKPVVHADHIGASTFIEKGWSRISLGEYEAAETALLKALALSPNDPQSESLLGWARMLQEKYDEALGNFQRVLMRQPANALARINVGYICLKKGIFGEAIEHLSKAIRLGNDRKATLYAHFYLGLVYLEREMYEDAETFFQKTIALGPNLIEAHYELGRARWYAGNRDGAMASWRAGHAANRFNPWGKKCAEVLEIVAAGGEPPKVAAPAVA